MFDNVVHLDDLWLGNDYFKHNNNKSQRQSHDSLTQDFNAMLTSKTVRSILCPPPLPCIPEEDDRRIPEQADDPGACSLNSQPWRRKTIRRRKRCFNESSNANKELLRQMQVVKAAAAAAASAARKESRDDVSTTSSDIANESSVNDDSFRDVRIGKADRRFHLALATVLYNEKQRYEDKKSLRSTATTTSTTATTSSGSPKQIIPQQKVAAAAEATTTSTYTKPKIPQQEVYRYTYMDGRIVNNRCGGHVWLSYRI